MRRILLLALILGVGYLAAILAASELGGEVAVLSTEDGNSTYQTSVWVVEDRGQIWIRAGNPDVRWLKRLEQTPEVQLERGGSVKSYQARVMVGQRDRINRLMAERYGWADTLIGWTRDGAGTVPVRLDPIRQ